MTAQQRPKRLTINKDFDSFDHFVRDYVTNVSTSGLFVRTPTPLSVGDEVELRFTVVMEGVETIEGVGQVVRVEHDPPGMGVVFTELSTPSRTALERLVALADH